MTFYNIFINILTNNKIYVIIIITIKIMRKGGKIMEEGYIVIYGEKKNNDFDIKSVTTITKDLKFLLKNLKTCTEDLAKDMNGKDDYGFYASFGGKLKNNKNDGCVAKYYVQEMRTETIYAIFKVYEVKFYK